MRRLTFELFSSTHLFSSSHFYHVTGGTAVLALLSLGERELIFSPFWDGGLDPMDSECDSFKQCSPCEQTTK